MARKKKAVSKKKVAVVKRKYTKKTKVEEVVVPAIQGMNYSTALSLLNLGYSLTRSGWNGKGMSIKLQRPTELSKMTLPYIYITTASGDLVPWVASHSDQLSNDWYIV